MTNLLTKLANNEVRRELFAVNLALPPMLALVIGQQNGVHREVRRPNLDGNLYDKD